MNSARFERLTAQYPKLRIAVMGDYSLDRYLEIDPAKAETSIETGLQVHNVVRVRSQAGAAGTILNNLLALGLGEIHPVGFCGLDGEGFELQRALRAMGPSVCTAHFISTECRQTFTYCKPLVVDADKAPVELNRLDTKNWTPTPDSIQERIIAAVHDLVSRIDALVLLDQVDFPETGVITTRVLNAIGTVARANPGLLILADSRRGLQGYPSVSLKMNLAELKAMAGSKDELTMEQIRAIANRLAQQKGRYVFVTMAEQGIIGVSPSGDADHVKALPLRGEIDIVGAGDAVTANLVASLSAGAGLREALELANAAASIVIHQLGTTGTASVASLRTLAVARHG